MATAVTATQHRSYDSGAHGYGYVTFDQFDPALGTLAGVTLTVTPTLGGALSVENMDLAPVALSGVFTASYSFYGPSYNYLQVSASVERSASLAAFDGTVDFYGTSGIAFAAQDTAGAASSMAVPAGDFYVQSYYVGTGSVNVSGYGSLDLAVAGGANMRLLATSAFSADVALSYDYTPVGDATNTAGVVSTTTGGSFTYVPTEPTVPSVQAASAATVTSTVQRFALADRATGWSDLIGATQFDPTLGTLSAVNVRLSTNLTTSARLESHRSSVRIPVGDAVGADRAVALGCGAGHGPGADECVRVSRSGRRIGRLHRQRRHAGDRRDEGAVDHGAPVGQRR